MHTTPRPHHLGAGKPCRASLPSQLLSSPWLLGFPQALSVPSWEFTRAEDISTVGLRAQ